MTEKENLLIEILNNIYWAINDLDRGINVSECDQKRIKNQIEDLTVLMMKEDKPNG